MDGIEVMPAVEAAERGDVFVTVTGPVARREHLERMKDGAVLANAGHFDVEIDLDALRELATGGVRQVLPLVEQYDLGERRLNLLAQGRVVNLAAGEGHPAGVMDMSFANLALAVEQPRGQRRRAGAPRARRAQGDRRGDRPPEAGVAGRWIDSLTPDQQAGPLAPAGRGKRRPPRAAVAQGTLMPAGGSRPRTPAKRGRRREGPCLVAARPRSRRPGAGATHAARRSRAAAARPGRRWGGRVCDRRAGLDRDGRPELAADLGDQHFARWWGGTVECR